MEQDADDRDAHVLEHDALRHGRAREPEQRRHIAHSEREREIRRQQQDECLPQRVSERLTNSAHLRLARNLTRISSWAAESCWPKFLGITPANFSKPFAVSASGKRIDRRM